ncbi:hypothetical protein AGLY_014578 [Aphis glycines]|uniref:Uncharacterized protein n=1 Tax=Aphis glycines TaxID=307491 RepID=A0A6G0T297_APHGL|nr:hypothetical protein AGLY_014578 [Aphis glycines]
MIKNASFQKAVFCCCILIIIIIIIIFYYYYHYTIIIIIILLLFFFFFIINIYYIDDVRIVYISCFYRLDLSRQRMIFSHNFFPSIIAHYNNIIYYTISSNTTATGRHKTHQSADVLITWDIFPSCTINNITIKLFLHNWHRNGLTKIPILKRFEIKFKKHVDKMPGVKFIKIFNIWVVINIFDHGLHCMVVNTKHQLTAITIYYLNCLQYVLSERGTLYNICITIIDILHFNSMINYIAGKYDSDEYTIIVPNICFKISNIVS